MRQKLSFAVLALVAFGVVALAAQQKPNFSGRWVTVSPAEAAGQEQVVTHDGQQPITMKMVSVKK